MELSQDSFFHHIRFSMLSSLEIYDSIALLTDDFKLKKLELLKNDFTFFLSNQKRVFRERFSIDDVYKAILTYNLNKAEELRYENLIENGKLLLIEKLLYPNEFYACYRFLETLNSEIKDYKENPKDNSMYNLKSSEIKYGTNNTPSVNGTSNINKKNKKEIILNPTSFKEIFLVKKWRVLINVLGNLEPPLIDKELNFIGSSRGGKGIICNWILTLQTKGKIKSSIKRQILSAVLNNEIKGLDLGKDGSTFSKVNNEYEKKWEEKLLKLAGLLP